MSFWRRINWVNTIFLTITPLVAIVGTTLLCVFGMVHWQTWVLAGVLLILSGLSITGGYHRLFAHGSYQAPWPVRLCFALIGAATFEGSILEWCTDHRNHHRYTDTKKDPYDINRGFWYAHMGWLFVLDESARDYSNVEDLMADPIIRLQHKYFPLIAALIGFGLPTAIAALWGDPICGFIIAGALRITATQQFTFCINSVCHLFGGKTYSEQSARDNWLTALVTFGEGYHNFHHQFPIDYRNGIRSYDWDPTKWLIRGLSYIGLASNLKRVAKHRIIRYRVRAENTLVQQAVNTAGAFIGQMGGLIKSTHESLLNILARVEELEKGYEQLKRDKINYMAGKMSEYRHCLIEYRKSMRQTRRELRRCLSIWTILMKQQKQVMAA